MTDETARQRYRAELGADRRVAMSEQGPWPSEPLDLEVERSPSWTVTRRACSAYQKVRTLVHQPDATDFPCPRCGGETVPAAGPDALK